MRRALLPLAIALASGCSQSAGDIGYAVRLHLLLDGSISDAQVSAIHAMELSADSSEEHWYHRAAVTTQFQDRKATQVYRPGQRGGALDFDVRVRDGNDHLIGEGRAEVTLSVGATVDADLVIAAPVVADLGMRGDLPMPDLMIPPDLAMPPPPPDMTKPAPPPDMAKPPPPPDMAMTPADLAQSD